MKIHHIKCVNINSPFGPAIGHCLILAENDRLVLIDSGLGLEETKNPTDLLGNELVAKTGYILEEKITAINQIKQLGYEPINVTDIICSHLDPDHIGGLVDFPNARVHVSQEEYESFKMGHERYLPRQLSHNPEIVQYSENDFEILGLPARKLNLTTNIKFYYIPLFGHTKGHCGVAFKAQGRWLLYVGDAYYYRAELTNKKHPVDQLATIAAFDNEMRKDSLEKLRALIKKYNDNIDYFSYHDPNEMESSAIIN